MALAKKQQILGFIGWLLISFIAAAIGAIASIDASTFYSQQLSRPDWAPPANVFGPVWGILYALMGISAWLVWRSRGFHSNKTALVTFISQLIMNALWSWIFFAWHHGALAFADIIFLWLLIAATIVAFWRIKPLAGALLIPYLIWVSFAAALNYAVWQLNPSLLG